MESTFQRALTEIGEDGYFQKKFDFIYNVIFSTLWPMAYMNLILALVIVPHTCKIPDTPVNITDKLWKEKHIPGYTDAVGEYQFQNCIMFVNSSSSNDTKACDEYEYDKTWYEWTVPTENNWVCDKELYVANIYASSKIGELVGSIVFGWFGDKYGRRPTYVLSLLFIIIGRVISLLAGKSFIWFVIGCVVAAFPSCSALQSVAVISLEMSTPSRRLLTTTLRYGSWSIGTALLALLFWWLRDWKIYFIITTVTQIPFLIFSWQVIESPRWLWVQGKTKDCVKYLKYIAEENNTTLEKETENDILTAKPVNHNVVSSPFTLFSGWRLAKNTILQLIIWVCVSLTYGVIIMNSGEKTDGNPFLELVWQSLVEVPGYFIGAWLANRIGRRYTGSVSMAVTAVAWTLLALRENSPRNILHYWWIGSVLVITNRMSITVAFYVINLFNLELFPTCMRQSGMSLCNVFSSAGAAISPYILYLGRRIDNRLSSTLLIGISLLGLICNLLLPETMNAKLPETIEDAQVFGKREKKYSPITLRFSKDEVTQVNY